ncbi:hypothetical protein PAXINDRAFT_20521 [Paxillus involutus ATCC 200175]|uniref:Uncharacterized protein n=1 Tax=Paxillus involutus ATCC 200175 TaxID=664439 RepID=A0A0C9SUU7_PAXIN|nr:hypothetical protein PAXINDRAFT_20521 [Paxillus involutus ATCC 200175]
MQGQIRHSPPPKPLKWSLGVSITSTIPLNSTGPARASQGPQPTPLTDPSSPAVAPREASSSTTGVTPAQSSVSSNNIPPASAQALSYSAVVPVPVAVPISLEELVMLQEFRRHTATAEPLSGPGHDREPFTYPYASPSLSESRGFVTPNT